MANQFVCPPCTESQLSVTANIMSIITFTTTTLTFLYLLPFTITFHVRSVRSAYEDIRNMRIGLETRERVWQQWVNVVYFPHRRSIPGVQDALNEAVVGLQRTAETLQRLVPRHAHNTDNLRSWYKFGTGQKFMRVRDRLKETLASCDAYFESAKLLAETSMPKMDQEVLLNVILEKLQSLESRLESRLQSSSDGCAKILDEMGKPERNPEYMFLEIQERLKLLQSRFLGSSNEESRELAIISDAETSVPIAPTTEEDREASGERRRHNVDSYFLVPERLEGGHGESSSSLVPHHSIARQAHEYPPDYEQASSPAKDVSGNETE